MKGIIDPASQSIILVPNTVVPALCLDLDGTVRHSKSGSQFITGPHDVALFDGVEEKIWEWRDTGHLIFGVSNQGGVAWGYKTPADNDREIDATVALFTRNPFHIIKTCLHLETGKFEPYNHRSLLRKPQVGMLALCEVEAWVQGYIVDWDRSLVVGDRPEDEELARNAGIEFSLAWDFFQREKPEEVKR